MPDVQPARGLNDDKYTVYDAEGRELDPKSYLVIRQQDMFGPAALYGYAHTLQNTIEVHRLRPHLLEHECDYLQQLAFELVNRAADWQEQGGQKIPD